MTVNERRLQRVLVEEPHSSPVNPNESLHSSLRDRLVRFKRATKAVNGLDMVKHSLTLVL